MDISSSKVWEMMKEREAWHAAAVVSQRVRHDHVNEMNWTEASFWVDIKNRNRDLQWLFQKSRQEMWWFGWIYYWNISWNEEPAGLQSMGSQNIIQDWVTECMRTHTHVIEVINIKNLVALWCRHRRIEDRASEQNCHAWFRQRTELPFFAKTIGAAHFRWKFRNPVWYTKSRIFKWKCKEINPTCAFEK